MRVLVACEESQAVTIELRKLNITAFSCDIQECSGGFKEWHIKADVTEVLKEKWDLIIAFPPCTHLAVSGAKHFEEKRKDGRQKQAIDFFMQFVNAGCDKIAIENPIGIMSKIYRKPDQIIQPYYFGDTEQKTTCLWLKNLPKLVHTKENNLFETKTHVQPAFSKSGLTRTHIGFGAKNNSKMRSKTFPGIAQAMAVQWSKYLINGI